MALTVAVVASFAASASAAVPSSPAKVVAVHVYNNNGWIDFDGYPSGATASCLSQELVAFPLNTDAGKAMLSIAQAAFLSGKSARVFWGTTCATGFDGFSYPVITGISYSNN